MRLAIDCVSQSVILRSMGANGETHVFAGGSNYVRNIVAYIAARISQGNGVILIIPDGAEGASFDSAGRCECRGARTIATSDLSDVDVLLLPLVNGSCLRLVPRIKAAYPKLKIAVVIHDVNHNITRIDPYDWHYGRRGREGLLQAVPKRMVFRAVYSHALRSIDIVFTVSSYSMQRLESPRVKEVVPLVQQIGAVRHREGEADCSEGGYALFVSGGRPEKNLLRTLEAFCAAIPRLSADMRLVVTGISDECVDLLLASGKLDVGIVRERVSFRDYVSDEELDDLYRRCRYVVFTSKAEGYGLPVREALSYGKPIIAAYTTSVPEVAGSCARYVDPYDVTSIARALIEFERQEVRDRYSRHAGQRSDLLDRMAEQDAELMLARLRSLAVE